MPVAPVPEAGRGRSLSEPPLKLAPLLRGVAGITMGMGRTGGMGMLSMFKTENQQVAVLTGAICAAGTLFYVAFNLSGELPPPTSPPSLPNAPRRLSGCPADRARHSSRHLCSRVRAVSLCSAVSNKLPSTFSPQWIQAQSKYRAAQNQDPISALR